MNAARDEAWRFALSLAPLSTEQQVSAISKRDIETARIAEKLLHLGPLAMWIWNREAKDVAHNIQLLARGELDDSVAA